MKTRHPGKPYERMFESVIDAKKVLPEIARIFKEKDIDFCIIGGISLEVYGYPRATGDVDVLVLTEDLPKVHDLIGTYIRPKFPTSNKKFVWNHSGAQMDVLLSREISGGLHGLPFEDPKNLRNFIGDIPYISLEKLIEYKLSSWKYGNGRLKDAGDVQELIKINHLPKDYGDDFRSDLKDAYREIWVPSDEETDESIF